MDSEEEIEPIKPSAESFFLPVKRIGEWPSLTERYFAPRFYIPPTLPFSSGHQCILLHSNRVGVVTLSPYHPILLENKTVTNVDFQIDDKINRADNKVTGKLKKGGQKLQPNSILCRVHCSDGSQFTLLACMHGRLIEINERLIDLPNLITEKPWSDGYLAIIFPLGNGFKTVKDTLLTSQEYLAKINNQFKDSITQNLHFD